MVLKVAGVLRVRQPRRLDLVRSVAVAADLHSGDMLGCVDVRDDALAHRPLVAGFEVGVFIMKQRDLLVDLAEMGVVMIDAGGGAAVSYGRVR